jgi:diguanylate cyclase (GGDEF)-like protein
MKPTIKELKKENEELRREVKKLKAAVWIDFLTQIFNRQAFYGLMKAACKEVAGEKKHPRRRHEVSQFSLLLIDIDDFKKLNDERGHLYGDKILRKTAQLLKDCVREFDVVARWGGEEFIIILRGTKISQARRKAEFMVEQARKRLPITISIGVTQSSPKLSPAQMFKKADIALYRAKRLGKNRVAG